MTKKNATGEVPKVTKIANKPCGRPLLLGDFVQDYIRALRKADTPISVPVVIAASEGIIIARNRCNEYSPYVSNRSLRSKFGGHLELSLPWAVSILQRMGREGVTPRRKQSCQMSKSPN